MTKAPHRDARPPFWRHRYYYLALKVMVLIVAAALALRFLAWLLVS
jgi:hypothetical protein